MPLFGVALMPTSSREQGVPSNIVQKYAAWICKHPAAQGKARALFAYLQCRVPTAGHATRGSRWTYEHGATSDQLVTHST